MSAEAVSLFRKLSNRLKGIRLEFLISCRFSWTIEGDFFTCCQVVVLIVLKIGLSEQWAERLRHKKRDTFGNLCK